MNPEQLTSTPTKQDLLNDEIQKLALKTHLEVQQRDLAGRMKFVPLIFVQEKVHFAGKKIRVKFSKDGSLENGRVWRVLLSRVQGGY